MLFNWQHLFTTVVLYILCTAEALRFGALQSPSRIHFRTTLNAITKNALNGDSGNMDHTSSVPTRVLMVLSNHAAIEGTDISTGWYLPECAHPYNRFSKAGYNIEFASIKGGWCPVTPSSLGLNDTENDEFWGNANLRSLTQNSQALRNCNPKNFDLVFFVGGSGTMWDFPFDGALASFSQRLYERGGFIGAVCHGPIALMNVKTSDGKYLIEGEEVAGFCNEEEEGGKVLPYLPLHKGLGRTCEDIFRARGAKYTKAEPWKPHVAISNRIFTGQNPASAGPVADAIINAISYQKVRNSLSSH